MGSMRLKRGDLFAGVDQDGIVWLAREQKITLTPEDLRWLCTMAGSALLNELGKEASDGND
jgi:hypothetical protein